MSATLPYSFAKTHGILLAGAGDAQAELWLRGAPSPAALAEVRRTLGKPLKLTRISPADFDARLAEAYSGGGDNTAEILADVNEDFDLSQLMTDLPPVEDLLETQDDAPIIRMINALLTQAVRDYIALVRDAFGD